MEPIWPNGWDSAASNSFPSREPRDGMKPHPRAPNELHPPGATGSLAAAPGDITAKAENAVDRSRNLIYELRRRSTRCALGIGNRGDER